MKKIISGPGLTNQGVIILQSFFLLLAMSIEIILKDSLGLFTGIVIWICFAGAIYLGRAGTSFATAVTPPIALVANSILLFSLTNLGNFSISKVLISTIAALAATAPFLVSGAVFAWYFHLKIKQPNETIATINQV